MSWIEDAQEEKKRLTPKKGFNLVGFDDGGTPDEWGLYLIGNFDSEEEANKMLEKAQNSDPDGRFYIYPPDPNAAEPTGLASKFMADKKAE